ncbi:hypothetical protein FH972_004272 [Carpinus fangiana]|uniref:Uncharacterized protein n=1 Tax=Carpinus fangiana TaxID=176857 RepID=A0A5N6QP47_9ROSI|nr:hypothetical protein FH972_004272 [Carpinus fangiana]
MSWVKQSHQRMGGTGLSLAGPTGEPQEELGVAIRSKVLPLKKVVGRQEIEKMVRTIMEDKEGNAIRARVKELEHSAEKALSMGGSSFNALSELANHCSMKVRAP